MKAKETILVVDDNPESLKLLSGILSGVGYQVRPADSGERGMLDHGVNFLSKPFGRDAPAHKVRKVLDVDKTNKGGST